jgi:hypothetical protein
MIFSQMIHALTGRGYLMSALRAFDCGLCRTVKQKRRILFSFSATIFTETVLVAAATALLNL